MSDWYLSQLARQDQYGDTPPANWPVPQMPEQDAFEAAAARVRAPYRNAAPVGARIGQLAEQVTSMPSWADVATQQMNKDKEAFQAGGIGSLLADTSVTQDLAGGFGGTTKEVKPVIGALAEVAPPFYSAAGRAVENAKLGKGTGEQWLGYLRNQPGVKQEELDWMFGNLPAGVAEKSVTNPGTYKGRQFWSGAFDPLDGHIIETHPYAKAEKADFHHSFYFSDRAQDAMKEGRAQFFWLDKDGNIQTQWREAGARPEIVQAIQKQLDAPGNVLLTKAQMQAHAAENEVRLGEVARGGSDYAKVDSLEAERRSVRADLNKARELFALDPGSRVAAATRVRELADRDQALTDQIVAAHGTPTKYSQWQLPGGENYRETLLTLPRNRPDAVTAKRLGEIDDELNKMFGIRNAEFSARRDVLAAERTKLKENLKSEFKSSHWDEPNVLAHVRTNDREIPGVGKSLHVEEIQSDWHQKGRQHGYAGEPNKQIADEYKAWLNENNLPQKSIKDMLDDDSLPRAKWDAVMGFQRRLEEAQAIGGNIPDAPFKSTWADVALKRQIREASEKGYDAISWTPGEAQAARYDLSKHVKEIEYIKRGDKYELGVTDINGSGVDMPNKAMTLKEIEDTLGKEMAEKIAKGEGQKFRGHEGNTLSGLDLKVGGEGMHGFYDKMLVDKANAIGKKHGARVEQSEITKPEMKLSYEELQRRRAGEAPDPSQFKQPVHVLRITPELRAAAMKGFPLFSAGGVVAGGAMGELARQDKYGRNE